MNTEKELIEITRASKRGSSFRITLPKKIAEKLLVGEGQFLGFYLENGKVVIDKNH